MTPFVVGADLVVDGAVDMSATFVIHVDDSTVTERVNNFETQPC
jgi:hypothetical protein